MEKSDKMKCKAIALVLIMVFAMGVGILTDESSAETADAETVKVYYNAAGTNTWTSSVQDAYNVYLAIYGARTDLGYSMATSATNTQWFVTSEGYSNPNMGYGLIDEINGSTSFTIYGYSIDSEWIDITGKALGWLRPYSDYSDVTVDGLSSSVYANVAIIQGTGSTATLSDMIAVTSVDGRSDCMYTFLLIDSSGSVAVPSGTQVQVSNGSGVVTQTLTTEQLQSGVTVVGYGSDAYLALKDAVGSSLVGQQVSWIDQGGYYTYYSWMDTLFGVGTTSEKSGDATIYHYWASYDSNMNYLNWTFGYYSILHFDASNVMNDFVIMYS